MYKIAVLGDYDSIYGFAAIGFDTLPLNDPEEAKTKINNLADSDYAVLYITEEWMEKLSAVIAGYDDKVLPAIIPVPGIRGNTGQGIENVKGFVEQAVGSDILFSERD